MRIVDPSLLWIVSSFVALALLAGCSDDENDTAPAPPQQGFRGLFVLNEGQWTLNNASLSFYDPNEGYAHQQGVFEDVNGTRLGDVANDALVRADTLFILMNNSRRLYKVQLPTLELLAELPFPDDALPNEFLWHAATGELLITSMDDDRLFRVDPQAMAMRGTIKLERSPGPLLAFGERTVVGLGNFPPSTNSRLAVVDPAAGSVAQWVDLPVQNPVALHWAPDGRLWAVCSSDFFDNEPGAVSVLSPTGGDGLKLDTTLFLPADAFGTSFWHGGELFVLSGSGTGTEQDFVAIGGQSLAQRPGALTENDLGLSESEVFFAARTDSSTGEVILTAHNGPLNGRGFRLGPELQLQQTFETGVFPGTIFRVP